MHRKVKTLEAVEVKDALGAHGPKLAPAEEQLLRMTHGAGLRSRTDALPRKSDDPAVRARLEAMELELLQKWRAHLGGASPAATKKDKIVRVLKKKT
jgi:hypothetical protein